MRYSQPSLNQGLKIHTNLMDTTTNIKWNKFSNSKGVFGLVVIVNKSCCVGRGCEFHKISTIAPRKEKLLHRLDVVVAVPSLASISSPWPVCSISEHADAIGLPIWLSARLLLWTRAATLWSIARGLRHDG